MLNKRVEYPIDQVNSGVGVVVDYSPETDLATVIDEDDGGKFVGPADKLIVLD